MEYKRIRSKSKSDQVVEQIINAVLEGRYNAGDRLPIESELAKLFGVSRITIREAFQKLSLMGLVDVREGRGSFISQPGLTNYMNPLLTMLILDEHDAASLYEARLWLELGLASLAAKNASDAEIKKLEEIHHTMVRNFSKRNQVNPVYTFSDQKFHETLSEMSHNDIMIKMYKTVQDIYRSFIAKTSTLASGREASLVEHGSILAAIRARDSAAAEKAMRQHILMAYELYKQTADR